MNDLAFNLRSADASDRPSNGSARSQNFLPEAMRPGSLYRSRDHALVVGLLAYLLLGLWVAQAIEWKPSYSVGRDLAGLCHGGGRYVAVGDQGTIVTSTDGVGWRAVSSVPTGRRLLGVAYGNGRFVAVGESGTILFSNDGLVWTANQAYPTRNSLGRVIFANGRFLAVGENGAIVTSSNGSTWEDLGSRPTVNSLTGATFAAGLYVVVGERATILTSSDARRWTSLSSVPTTRDLRAVTYGNGRFVVVGNHGQILTSTDGSRWQGIGLAPTGSDLFTVRFAHGSFVAAGANGTLFTSTNGITWAAERTSFGRRLADSAPGPDRDLMLCGQNGQFVRGIFTPEIVELTPSMKVVSGRSVVLRVVARGVGLRYQWYAGESGTTVTPLQGATGSSVSVAVKFSSSYWVRVTNDAGHTASTTIRLDVGSSVPVITRQPQGTTIRPGATAALEVMASGSNLSYQWYVGGRGDVTRPLSSGRSNRVTVQPTQTTRYWVRVSTTGGRVDSNAAEVKVEALSGLPRITNQPQGTTIQAGQSHTLTVAAEGASPRFQWYEGTAGSTSKPVSAATSASLTVRPASTTSYWVRVSNASGTVDSSSARIIVVPVSAAPVITSQPESKTIVLGQATTLRVAAVGSNLTYRWYRGTRGVTTDPVSGGNGNGLTVNPASSTTYWVRVSNTAGSMDSTAATIRVESAGAPPVIFNQPQDQTITEGSLVTLNLRVSADIVSVKFHPEIPDRQSIVIQIPFINPPDYAYVSFTDRPSKTTLYWAEVSNAFGQVTTRTVTVTVIPKPPLPVIASQPESRTIRAGATATLGVAASGTGLTYQWYHYESGNTARPIVGATGPTLVVSPQATRNYWVRVSNPGGHVDSRTATVTVREAVAAPAITRQPSGATIRAGGTATLRVEASGSQLAYQWYYYESGNTTRAIPGQTSATLQVSPNVTRNYWVRVTNPGGHADSRTVTVAVGN